MLLYRTLLFLEIIFLLLTFHANDTPYFVDSPIQSSIVKILEENKSISEYDVVNARISGYAPYDNKSGMCNDGNTLTSRGVPASRKYIAIDPRLIPYGSKIEIEGFDEEVFVAGDTGGVMRNKGNKGIYAVDVFFESYDEAMEFGIQWREIKIYKEE